MLLLFILLTLLMPLITNSLVCYSHHEFFEEGKRRAIGMSSCGASNGFCVKAIYWDTDASKKRGFSRGCDKNDCLTFGDPAHGWGLDGCRKHRDFGTHGEICCCQFVDYCNGSTFPAALLSCPVVAVFYLVTTLLF